VGSSEVKKLEMQPHTVSRRAISLTATALLNHWANHLAHKRIGHSLVLDLISRAELMAVEIEVYSPLILAREWHGKWSAFQDTPLYHLLQP
jgi:hypothetical protein